ncbi:MAG: OmpA family protein [bacterium]
MHPEDDLGVASSPGRRGGVRLRPAVAPGGDVAARHRAFGEHPPDDLLRPDDGNGFTDCDDFSCSQNPWVTACGPRENSDTLCSDGLDNDGNNFADCDDFACQRNALVGVCGMTEAGFCIDGRDTDGDGLVDADDRCPADPEDVDDFQDHDGCPDLDNDGDGVADAQDWCPNESGIRQWEGCNGVTVAVPFPFASARPEPEAAPLLAEMAAILREHATVRGVLIEGHTDDRGTEAFNLRLSLERALAIREALVAAGIPAGRIEVMGHGETSPVVAVDGLTGDALAGARAQNRRVRFVLLRRSGGEAVSRAAAVLR